MPGFGARWHYCLALACGVGLALTGAFQPAGAEQKHAGRSPLAEGPDSREPGDEPLSDQKEESLPTWVFLTDGSTVKIILSAAVNRALLGWNDGGESDAYFVDNAQDGTFIGAEGVIDFAGGWKAGGSLGADLIYAASDEVDQTDSRGFNNRVELSDYYISAGHAELGTLILGYADTASDGIDNISLTEADTIADADVPNWNANFFIRDMDGNLTEARWGDFVDGTLAGDTRRLIGYKSPQVRGFEAAVAVSDDYWDAAVRYSGEWGETVKVQAGIGYWQDTLGNGGELVDDTGWGGSLAARHLPTGLNLAFSFGVADHSGNCADPGLITGRCRGKDNFTYLTGGIVRDFAEWGATSVYGEYYREKKRPNESDPAILEDFESAAGGSLELARGRATVWGAGVVQEVEGWHTELYFGYRRYRLDVDLIGAMGPASARGLDDFDVVMAGAKFSY